MGVKEEQRDRAVAHLAAHLLQTGLAQTSLRQLAAAAGVSDRMLLYYFADKAEALAAAMGRVAEGFAESLSTALPEGKRWTPAELVQLAGEFTMQPEMRRFMRLWVEVIAAAARAERPFGQIAEQIMTGFRQWVDVRLQLPPDADRAAVAAAVIAVIDGLALVEICIGKEATSRAAKALGFFQP
jgi:AcrR family transcriptional regulator